MSELNLLALEKSAEHQDPEWNPSFWEILYLKTVSAVLAIAIPMLGIVLLLRLMSPTDLPEIIVQIILGGWFLITLMAWVTALRTPFPVDESEVQS